MWRLQSKHVRLLQVLWESEKQVPSCQRFLTGVYFRTKERSMQNVFQAIIQALDSGESVAVLTVVRASGSTPRHLPSNMMVHADGSFVASIGGGTMELQAMQD